MIPRRFPRNAAGAAALAACLALALAPGAARAESLVYVKSQRVYVSRADGSAARPVTPRSAWWAWPSQSDTGRIAVAGGAERVNPGGTSESSGSSEIYAFDQQGRPLLSSPVHTPGSVSGPTAPTYVSHFRISPDGSRVAYNVLGCCGLSGASTFTSPLRAGSADWSTFQDDYIDPVWVDASGDPLVGVRDALALTHNGVPAWGNAEYAVYDGTNRNRGDGSGWGEDTAIPDGWGFEVTFARRVGLVALLIDDAADSGGTPQHVQIHLETVSYSGMSTDHCTLTLPASHFARPRDVDQASPSFTTDGRTLAWGQDDGVYEANVSNPGDCAAIDASIHRVVRGGAMPSFSAAPLRPAKPVAAFSWPNRVRAGHRIRFDAAASHEPGGRIVGYRWRFGDGRKASGRKVTHVFKRARRYTVALTVRDARGHRSTVRAKVKVRR